MTFYITHLGDIRIRNHRVGFTLASNRNQTKPQLSIHLHGPNGSACGYGPKAWPMQEWLRKRHNARMEARAITWWEAHACAYCKGDDNAECECDGYAPPCYPRTWSSSVRITLPYIGWNTLYRTRRFLPTRVRRGIGSAQYRAYNALYSALKDRSNRLCREAQTRGYRTSAR